MAPNPFRNPKPWQRVRIGGRLIKSVLTKWNGLKIEDGWKADKSKSTNGSVFKFTGTNPVGGDNGFSLTFKAYDEASFDDLYAIFDILAPVPGQGGGTTATAATGQTSGVGQPPASTTTTSGSGTTGDTGTSGSSSLPAGKFGAASDQTQAKADPDPGPRPPTLPIENAVCAFFKVFAVARKSIELTYNESDLSWECVFGFIHDNPPTPAGAGAMAAPASTTPTSPGAQWTGAKGGGSADPAQQAAGQQAAGT